MQPIKPELVLPIVAVTRWKNREFTRMEIAIIRHALANHYVYPGDIPEDIVDEDSRQGVASNGWTVLVALEIIRRSKTGLVDEARGIVLGRKRNRNKKAKGRWTGMYELNNRGLAMSYLERVGATPLPPKPMTVEQLEII